MGLDSDYVLYLCGNTIRFRTWKVNFIDYRKYIQVVVEGKVYIGQRLGLNSLCGVYNKNRSVAGCEAPRYFIVEIDMAWGIDEVEDILFSVFRCIYGTDCLGLDRDSTLTL